MRYIRPPSLTEQQRMFMKLCNKNVRQWKKARLRLGKNELLFAALYGESTPHSTIRLESGNERSHFSSTSIPIQLQDLCKLYIQTSKNLPILRIQLEF